MDAHTYIGGVQRFSTEDGPGIRTTVFLKGCPLACQWCHNPELMDGRFQILYRKERCILCGECMNVCPAGAIHLTKDGVFVDMERCISCGKCVENCCSEALHTKSAEYTMEELMDLLKKDRQYYDSSGGGITLSGGEVLAHGTHALKIAENARKEGISVAIETSGYGDYEKLYSLARICDWILFDLKHMDAVSHKTYVGASPERIWENLRRLAAVPGMGEKIIIRVPMIHPVNDTVENIQAIGEFMRQNHLRTIHLLPYHDMGIAKAREMGIEQKRFETPSDEVLEAAAKLLRSYGLTAEIMGKEAV